jgi:hypothetical protein
MKTLRNMYRRFKSLPTWGKVMSIVLLANEVRGAFVAYYVIDNGGLTGSFDFGSHAGLFAILIIPAIIGWIVKRRRTKG